MHPFSLQLHVVPVGSGALVVVGGGTAVAEGNIVDDGPAVSEGSAVAAPALSICPSA